MKILWALKFFLPYALFISFLSVYSVKDRWGSDSSDKMSNVDVRSIRQNPGSFRSHYFPMYIRTGGK